MAATGDIACPVLNAAKLADSRADSPAREPLFRLERGAFDREYVLGALRRCLLNIGEHPLGLTGHSFRRGAAQHADTCGLSKDQKQALGRWNSDAVDRYYTKNTHHLFALQRRFANITK
ncbi:hypothetical protein F4804DRAFT_336026 [Jackrogersella minutella]|nr:hypothetical protein F4804DRAFT_336026 [Jackrogersella minutella]